MTLRAPNQTITGGSTEHRFRRIEIVNRELRINGRAPLIKGVNRHDHSPTEGKIISEALLRLDLDRMKQHNINAIRTSHYPNASAFTSCVMVRVLCDRGLTLKRTTTTPNWGDSPNGPPLCFSRLAYG